MPLQLFPRTEIGLGIGIVLLAMSAAFARWAFVTMRTFGTSANPYKPTRAIATDGPFQYSRNPIYVAMTGLYVGLAFMVNTLWPLILLPFLLAVMIWGVIEREERTLASQFGETYLAYKSKVRRWL